MNDGRRVQIGTPAELFERPEHTFVGYFIGSPGMNLLPAEISTARAPGRRTRVSSSARAYPAPADRRARPARLPARLRHADAASGVPVQGPPRRRSRPQASGACRSRRSSHGRHDAARDVERRRAMRASPSIPRRRMSTSTTSASREAPHDRQAAQQPRLVLRPAGAGVRAVLLAHADDDRGELFGSGHDGREQLLLERRRLVPRPAEPDDRNRRALQRRAVAQRSPSPSSPW